MLPTRTFELDEDGLDVLELALGGALPGLALPAGIPPDADELLLTDAGGAPLARLTTEGSGAAVAAAPRLEALGPFVTHAGPQWDPALRLGAAAARERLAATAAGRPVLALVIDDVPTRADLDHAAAAIDGAGAGAVLVAIPVPRRGWGPRAVGAAGLVRAALAATETLRGIRTGTDVLPVVVPWPQGGGPWLAPDLASVVAAYGAPLTLRLTGLRGRIDRGRIAALAGAHEAAVRAVYPEQSATEVLLAGDGTRRRGAVVLVAGPPGSGAPALARDVAEALADGPRGVTLLDGDEVRRYLAADPAPGRTATVHEADRLGWVAALVARHGGIAVAAPIEPSATSLARLRALAEPHGPVLLVRVGLRPEAAGGTDLAIDTTESPVDEAVEAIRSLVEARLGA